MKLYLSFIMLFLNNNVINCFSLSKKKIYKKQTLKCFNPFNDINNIEFSNKLSGNNEIISDFGSFIENNEKVLGRKIVTEISTLLPRVDSIGHNILHANNEFISTILGNGLLSDETKKIIILMSIKLAQQGDDFGSILLQQYYNIVDKCL